MKALQLSLFLLLSTSLYSQNNGFFGKKNVISFTGKGSIPVLSYLIRPEDHYFKKNVNTKSGSKDLFDSGFRASFSHAFTNKFALGFEYGIDFSNVKAPQYLRREFEYYNNWGYYDYMVESVVVNHENFRIRSHVFMPKIEFNINSAMLPIGINNQIGIGYTSTKVVDKDYNWKQTNLSWGNDTLVGSDIYDFTSDYSYSGISLMYALNLRTPLSKSLMLSYGIRYNLNISTYKMLNNEFIYLGTGYSSTNEETFWISKNEMREMVGKRRFSSIIQLEFGLSYAF